MKADWVPHDTRDEVIDTVRDNRWDCRRNVGGEGVILATSKPPSDIPEIFPMPQKTQNINSLNQEPEMSNSR